MLVRNGAKIAQIRQILFTNSVREKLPRNFNPALGKLARMKRDSTFSGRPDQGAFKLSERFDYTRGRARGQKTPFL